MDEKFINKIFNAHMDCPMCPSEDTVTTFFNELIGSLFPVYSKRSFKTQNELDFHMVNLKEDLYNILYMKPNREGLNAQNNTELFFNAIPEVYEKLQEDVAAIFAGDPAAKSESEVIRTYPGFFAIVAYRFAHELYKLGVMIVPRMITEYAHSRTGVDIHPGATIGKRFCIDHGTGIVIGETTVIGDNVKIYQGVTLGALSVNKEDAETKRHPTIEDHVVIYANATILGGNTTVGHHSIVGGNVWITQSVPAYTQVTYQNKVQSDEKIKTDSIRFKTLAK